MLSWMLCSILPICTFCVQIQPRFTLPFTFLEIHKMGTIRALGLIAIDLHSPELTGNIVTSFKFWPNFTIGTLVELLMSKLEN